MANELVSKNAATASVDIAEVHIYKHENGAEPTIAGTNGILKKASSAVPEGWFSVATLKGSVEVSQDNVSLTKINIDQSDMPIGISTEPGDFNVNFSLPSMLNTDLAKWLDGDSAAVDADVIDGKQGFGYEIGGMLSLTLLLKTKNGDWFCFPNVKGSVALAREDNVFLLKFSGQVLNATNSANKDVYIFADAKPASIT